MCVGAELLRRLAEPRQLAAAIVVDAGEPGLGGVLAGDRLLVERQHGCVG